MRRWRKVLAMAAGILGGLGGLAACAHGQMPPPPPASGFGFVMPPASNNGPPVNAFGAPANLNGGSPGGVFGGNPRGLAPPDFPNPAVPSQEPVSPFTLLPCGMQNAFSRGPVPAGASNGFTECSEPARTPVCRPFDLFVRADYLNWRVSSAPIAVPLVTTTSNLSVNNFGQLGNPNTTVLLESASHAIDYGNMSGARVTAGTSFFEVSGFWFSQNMSVYRAGSLDNPTQVLAIPYQFTEPGTSFPFVTPLNFPPNTAGFVTLGGTVAVSSQLTFWGTDANVFLPVLDDGPWKIEVLGGYRYLRLAESLSIDTVRGGPGPTFFQDEAFASGQFNSTTHDSFGTTNAFNGGQVGMRGMFKWGNWSVSGEGKIAIGDTAERLNINGRSGLVSVTTGELVQTAPGGLFALPSNSGTFNNNKFAVVPEANLTFSYHFDFVRVFAGYNFLYWSQVTRPGDALNNNIDPRQVPISGAFTPNIGYAGPGVPAMIQRGFIAQGLFAGVELQF